MAKGYVILTEAMKDPEGMKACAQAAGAAMGGVNVLAVDTAPKVVEEQLARQPDCRAGIRIGGRGPRVVRVGGLSEGSESKTGRHTVAARSRRWA
jgi:hypothetical protein